MSYQLLQNIDELLRSGPQPIMRRSAAVYRRIWRAMSGSICLRHARGGVELGRSMWVGWVAVESLAT